MKIDELFSGKDYIIKSSLGSSDDLKLTEIKKLEFDSRRVDENSLYFALQNGNIDGNRYIEDSYKNGCRAFVVNQESSLDYVDDSIYVVVDDVNEAFAIASSNVFFNPKAELKLISVTGTNGKTTITSLMERCLKKLDKKVGLIGTVENHINDKIIPANNTTPFANELHSLLDEMRNAKCEFVSMEVSSHSYVHKRIYGLEFELGIFTNLTQDHLDFHGTMDNYRDAKLGILKMAKKALINLDTPYSKFYYDSLIKSDSSDVYTYGIGEEADFRAMDIDITLSGSSFDVLYDGMKEHLHIATPGEFSVYNALATIGGLVILGFDFSKVCEILNTLDGVAGRFQTFSSNHGFSVVVDYAHTPDGLLNILDTAKKFVKGKIITVFGCGGDRDATKRPIMGRIAAENSDYVFVTSDNPRTEDPNKIIEDILVGVKETGKDFMAIVDRRNATEMAIKMAKENDLVIIAGKGHEDYQILGHEKIHYSDIEIVQELIK